MAFLSPGSNGDIAQIPSRTRHSSNLSHPHSQIQDPNRRMSNAQSNDPSKSSPRTSSCRFRGRPGPMSLATIVHEKDIPCVQACSEQSAPVENSSIARVGTPHSDEATRLKNEKKRQWRKNLTPDKRNISRQRDADRKRKKRQMLTEQQRSEERQKDARRKAMKRKAEKEQATMKCAIQGGASDGSKKNPRATR